MAESARAVHGAGRWRAWVAGLLVLTGCLLAVVSAPALWARNQILDTDRFLATVGPLASDEVIQDEIARLVTVAITSRLNAAELARTALPQRAAFLAPSLGEAVDAFVGRQATAFTRSQAFRDLWVGINREGHRELVSILTSDESASVAVAQGRLTLNLTAAVEAVRQRLATAGLSVVTQLPPITLVVDIADAQGLEAAIRAVRVLDLVATWLPWLALATLAAGVAVAGAGRRLRTAAAVGFGLVAAMVVLLLALAVGNRTAEANVPSSVASPDAVVAFYEQITVFLERGVLVTGAVAGLIGFAALAAARSVRPRVAA